MVISTQKVDIDQIVICDSLSKLSNLSNYCRSIGLTAPIENVSNIYTQGVVPPQVTEVAKDKTGVKLQGVEAINPVNGKQIPIFISDYVLVSYGTGAIMAVPAHDTRDWEFAKKFDLPIIEVVKG